MFWLSRHLCLLTQLPPLSLLLVGEGIRNVLRSYMMVPGIHPPHLLSWTGVCNPWSYVAESKHGWDKLRDCCSALYTCQQTQNTNAAFPSLWILVSSSFCWPWAFCLITTRYVVSKKKWILSRMINFSLTFRKLNKTFFKLDKDHVTVAFLLRWNLCTWRGVVGVIKRWI